MNSTKSNAKPNSEFALNSGHRTYGDFKSFKVTQEVWRPDGNGNMFCLVTGEAMPILEWKKRGKGTFLKITPKA